jgi:hypothetical protein
VLNQFGEEIETISKQRPAVGHSLHNATRKTTFSKQRQISLPERVGTPWPTPHQSSVPPTPSPFPSQTPASTSACNASDPRSLEQVKMPEQARACHYVEWSGKEVALPPLPPLRTGRETFASSGSSRTKAPRERSRCHDGRIPSWLLYDTRLQPSHRRCRLARGRTHG